MSVEEYLEQTWKIPDAIKSPRVIGGREKQNLTDGKTFKALQIQIRITDPEFNHERYLYPLDDHQIASRHLMSKSKDLCAIALWLKNLSFYLKISSS